MVRREQQLAGSAFQTDLLDAYRRLIAEDIRACPAYEGGAIAHK